jgi:c-di-GMP-binding flagellar brake protein YcgR
MDLRVLLVCPDQGVAEILRPILIEMGIQCDSTPSLSTGLERLAAEHFDAVLLDYHEDAASHEFLTGLRVSAKNRAAQLIAIVDGELSARPVFGLGANFVLYRPLSAERARTSLRAARGLMRRERRRSQRVAVTSAVTFDHAGAQGQPATLLDLSDGGSALRSERSLPPACKVYFQFALPGQSQLVRLSGEVAWQDSTGRTGIRFLNVPQTSRRLMQGWLQHNGPLTGQGKPAMPPASSLPSRPPDTRSAPSHTLLQQNASNRRGKFRFACKLGAEVYRLGSTVPNRCTLSDISEGGCYIETPSPFAAQTSVEVLVRTADVRLRIRGIVLAVHPGYGMGVRFMFRDTTEKEEILRLLAQLAAGPTLDPIVQ